MIFFAVDDNIFRRDLTEQLFFCTVNACLLFILNFWLTLIEKWWKKPWVGWDSKISTWKSSARFWKSSAISCFLCAFLRTFLKGLKSTVKFFCHWLKGLYLWIFHGIRGKKNCKLNKHSAQKKRFCYSSFCCLLLLFTNVILVT